MTLQWLPISTISSPITDSRRVIVEQFLPPPHDSPFKRRPDAKRKAARAPLVLFEGGRASKEVENQIADIGFLRRWIS